MWRSVVLALCPSKATLPPVDASESVTGLPQTMEHAMTCKLVTRKQVNQMFGLDYCAESYRRWEKKGYLTVIKMPGRSSRVYYSLDQVTGFFGT
jgi:hypothetical protein